MTAVVKAKKVLIGNRALMSNNRISIGPLENEIETLENQAKTVLILAVEGKAMGAIAVSDTAKEHSKKPSAACKRWV